MKVLLSGGGTAGHVNPAIAIAKFIQDKEPDSQILFIGTEKGIEHKLVPREGFDIRYIEVVGLRRRFTFENFINAFKAVKAYNAAKKIIKEFKPDVVIGTSGYVCAPVMYAAVGLKIPAIIHEQNVFPGLVVRALASKVDITAISFEDTKKYLKNPKRVALTGNPIRQSILDIKRERPGEGNLMWLYTAAVLGRTV